MGIFPMIESTIINAFFGVLLHLIAAKRGADKIFWLVMGIVFGPFALPFVFIARKHNKTNPTSRKLF